jgi:hypothetical protein
MARTLALSKRMVIMKTRFIFHRLDKNIKTHHPLAWFTAILTLSY